VTKSVKTGHRRAVALLAGLLLAAASPQDAAAWTDAGHRVVAQIASEHLTPEARRQVESLLQTQGAASLPDISMLADIAKAVPLLEQPSHVVHMPLVDRPYDPAKDCRKGRCALAALDSNVAILGDPQASMASRAAALAMVVHLVGDLHQPLHTSADTGQRKVRWKGERMTLHAFWDDEITAALGSDWQEIATEVGAKGCDDVADSDPVVWAGEGRDIARDTILADPRVPKREARDLPETYVSEAWPIARERLRLAGCRLAGLLNRILVGTGP
jgi:hypothetical protein